VPTIIVLSNQTPNQDSAMVLSENVQREQSKSSKRRRARLQALAE
jgi:hypothetical protein